MRAAEIDSNRDARPIIIAWMSEQNGLDYDEILDQVQMSTPEIASPPKDSTADNQEIPPPVKESASLLDHIKRLSGI
jgi:hypothetical protein